MHFHDQHFFVIRAIEDADAASLRQGLHATPQVVVVQFFRRRMFEAVHLAALRIDAGHHVLDGAVFAGRVHRLKDQQDRPTVGGVEQFLSLGQRGDFLREHFLRGRFPLRFRHG